MYIIMLALERQNGRQKVYLCVCFYVMRFLMAGIVTEFNFYTSNLPVVTKILQHSVTADVLYFVMDRIIYVAISFLVLYLGIRFFHKIYRYKHEDITGNELLFLCIPQLAVLFVRNMVLKYFSLFSEGIANGTIQENIPADGYRFLFYLTAYAMLLVMAAAYQKMKEDQNERHQTDLLAAQIRQMKNHLEQVELLYQEAQSLRHDMGNHIQVMEHLISDNKNEAAVEYLAGMKKQQMEITPVIKTGNPVTDIILEEKMREAQNRKIDFSCHYHFPSKSNMDAFDMSILLSNLLDNCLEAVNGEKPWIRIESEQVGDIYILNISNAFTGRLELDADTGLPVSSKGAGHGIGLHNVARVMKRYGGDVVFEQKKNQVIVSVALPSHP